MQEVPCHFTQKHPETLRSRNLVAARHSYRNFSKRMSCVRSERWFHDVVASHCLYEAWVIRSVEGPYSEMLWLDQVSWVIEYFIFTINLHFLSVKEIGRCLRLIGVEILWKDWKML